MSERTAWLWNPVIWFIEGAWRVAEAALAVIGWARRRR